MFVPSARPGSHAAVDDGASPDGCASPLDVGQRSSTPHASPSGRPVSHIAVAPAAVSGPPKYGADIADAISTDPLSPSVLWMTPVAPHPIVECPKGANALESPITHLVEASTARVLVSPQVLVSPYCA